jgi:DNA (cytosine-5)-methyltransferase 1
VARVINLLDRDFVAAPSGLILPTDVAEARYAPISATGIDLFCGAGGFSLGFIRAGFEIVAAVEYDADAAMTYMVNLCRWGEFALHFVEEPDRKRLEAALIKQQKRDRKLSMCKGQVWQGELFAGSGWIAHQDRGVPGCRHFIFGDVRKLTGERILKITGMERGEVGCVMGGPPCQGFTYANKKRSKDDPRNDLVLEFVRLVLEIAPRTMLMENVPGMLNMTTPDGLPIIDVISRALSDGSFQTIDMLRKAIAFQSGNVGFLAKPRNKIQASGKKGKKRD